MKYYWIRLIMIIQLCGRMSLFLGNGCSSIYGCNSMSITYHQLSRKKYTYTLLNLSKSYVCSLYCSFSISTWLEICIIKMWEKTNIAMLFYCPSSSSERETLSFSYWNVGRSFLGIFPGRKTFSIFNVLEYK